MTIEGAKTLRTGDYIHTVDQKNADGTPMRARVTSIKTWKTRPNRIEVHYKHGLYDYGIITELDLAPFSIGYGS